MTSNEGGELFRDDKAHLSRIKRYLDGYLRKDVSLGKQRDVRISEYCEQEGIGHEVARGLANLVRKFDRLKTVDDLVALLDFGEWIKEHGGDRIRKVGHLTYLADQTVSVQHMCKSMKANYELWTRVFGPDVFLSGQRVKKARLPLEGYFFSVKGGSGSGTFAIDVAIGYDGGEEHRDGGEIWRVGFDCVSVKGGENVFRIIRTGSGQKSQGSELLAQRNAQILSTFREKYKTPAQRLLLFIAIETAYALGFETAEALSTQGAMTLSLLGKAKQPIDYSASMSGVGFRPQEGNWLILEKLQERFFDIIKDEWFTDTRPGKDTAEYASVVTALNTVLANASVGQPLQLASKDEDLGKAWLAYKDIHSRRTFSRRRK